MNLNTVILKNTILVLRQVDFKHFNFIFDVDLISNTKSSSPGGESEVKTL